VNSKPPAKEGKNQEMVKAGIYATKGLRFLVGVAPRCVWHEARKRKNRWLFSRGTHVEINRKSRQGLVAGAVLPLCGPAIALLFPIHEATSTAPHRTVFVLYK